MSRNSPKAPSILAQQYVGKSMPLTIEIAQALTDAFNRDRQCDPLEEIEAAASKILTDAGIPPNGDISFICGKLHDLVARKGFGEGTQEWYAARLLERVHKIRFSAPSFQGYELHWRLLRLGHLMRSAEIEISHPGALDHAVNWRREVGSKNAEEKAKADRRHQKWLPAADEYLKRNPTHSSTACAKYLITNLKLDLEVGTARKIIARRRHSKK